MIRLTENNFKNHKVPFYLQYLNGTITEVSKEEIDVLSEYSLDVFLERIRDKDVRRNEFIYCRVRTEKEKSKLNAFIDKFPVIVY